MSQPTIYATIQIKNGLQANLPISGVIGEPFFTTDDGNLYVWNGSSMVQVNGSGSAILSGFGKAVVAKTSNYTATSTDDTILVNATSGNVTITLPTSGISTGKIYTIKKTDSSSHTVTLAPSSGTIDGQSNAVTSVQYTSLDVQFDGTNYWII
jgi:Major tropism determinant N-terminal domain